jgi:hypothetical protein
MTHLVWFACPGLPSKPVRDAFEQALAPLGDVSLVWIATPGLSSVFVKEALRHTRLGRTMPGLLRAYPPHGTGGPTTVSLICYSAGYGLARILLRSEEDRQALDGLVLLDALHTGLSSSGKVEQPGLEPFAAYARLAKEGHCCFRSGHTDVPTYGYASTTQSNNELVHMARGMQWHADGSGFRVHAFDTKPPSQPKAEHGAALIDWGPAFVGAALVPYLANIPVREPVREPPETSKPWRDSSMTLGERAVEFSLAELEAGVREATGNNDGPRIAEYLAGCTRKGTPLGLIRGNWCAASFCFAERAAILPGEEGVTPYVASGIELQNYAKVAGNWIPAKAVRERKESIDRGDGVILKRGSSRANDWRRHVCRVVDVDGDTYQTIGGNERNGWRITDRNVNDQDLLGFIAYPDAPPDYELQGPLFERSRRIFEGHEPMDEVQALIDELGDELTG